MSAAHCHQKDTISIAAGSLDKRYPTQRIDSLSFIKHPGYQGSANCLDYDYALILTRTDFDFSDPFVQSIPLPSPTMVELPSGTPMWQSGWGLFERNEIGDPAYLPDKVINNKLKQQRNILSLPATIWRLLFVDHKRVSTLLGQLLRERRPTPVLCNRARRPTGSRL